VSAVTAVAEQVTLPRRYRTPPWLAAWGVVFVCSWGGNQFSPLLLMYEDRAHYSSVLVNGLLGIYVLGLAPALLIAGAVSDRYGRKPVALIGVAAGAVGSILLALGLYGPGFLAAGRLFSGVTVGIAMAVGNSWIKELSQAPYEPDAAADSGARRAALAFTLGSAFGALTAGLIAQWGPAPQVVPFVVHLLLTAPFLLIVRAIPETDSHGGHSSAKWWQNLRPPSVAHPRFTRVVLVCAPWIFGSAAIGYGYLPTRLGDAAGSWGLVFATATTVVALGTSSAIQPVAKRLHTLESARGLATAVLLFAIGLAAAGFAIELQSVWLGLAANVVLGAGIGIALVSGLMEVGRIATHGDLAGATGVFYAAAYAGFLAPTVIAALTRYTSSTIIFTVIVALAVLTWLHLMVSSRKHLDTLDETG